MMVPKFPTVAGVDPELGDDKFFHRLVAGWVGPFCLKRMDPSVVVGERIAEERTGILLRQTAVSGVSPRMPACVLYPTLKVSPITSVFMTVNRL